MTDSIDKIIDDAGNIEKSQQTIDNASKMISRITNLDGGILHELEELENEMFWRRFYFAGGPPKLIINDLPPTGYDRRTSRYEYDGKPKNTMKLTEYDPRYDPKYIQLANAEGFHRRLLWRDPSTRTLKMITFDTIHQNFVKCFDSIDGGIDKVKEREHVECNRVRILSELAALDYFDKIDSFMNDMNQSGYYDIETLEQIISSNIQEYNDALYALEKLMKVNKKEFQNYGGTTTGGKLMGTEYCFANPEIMRKWISLNAEYEQYRKAIYTALLNTNTLQLCDNSVRGNFVGENISISQSMNCYQSVVNGESVKDTTDEPIAKPDPSNEPTDEPSANESSNEEVPTVLVIIVIVVACLLLAAAVICGIVISKTKKHVPSMSGGINVESLTKRDLILNRLTPHVRV